MNQSAEATLRQLLRRNPDLAVDYEQSDPRLRRREAAESGGEPLERGPESDLEERLLNYIRAVQLPMPTFGYRFHPKRRWRFDLAYPGEMVAAEVDGGIDGVGEACKVCGRRANGGHNSRTGYASDREKINTAQIMGWIVIGVTREQIESGQAVEFIRQALNFRLSQKEKTK